MSNVVEFPKEKIVRVSASKDKGFHQKKIERLIHELTYEIARMYDEKEVEPKEQLHFRQVLPVERDDKRFTILDLQVFSSNRAF